MPLGGVDHRTIPVKSAWEPSERVAVACNCTVVPATTVDEAGVTCKVICTVIGLPDWSHPSAAIRRASKTENARDRRGPAVVAALGGGSHTQHVLHFSQLSQTNT